MGKRTNKEEIHDIWFFTDNGATDLEIALMLGIKKARVEYIKKRYGRPSKFIEMIEKVGRYFGFNR